jgi:hypothetical protein
MGLNKKAKEKEKKVRDYLNGPITNSICSRKRKR